MLLYNLPAQPSTQRVYVWRKLKKCGALFWQTSVCLLPSHPGFREQFERLKQDIAERHGEAKISTIQFPEPSEQKAVENRFRQQTDEEYQEFLGRCRDFHDELAKEHKASHYTFAELDENEVELEKLRSWLSKIQGRDFFHAALKNKARQALAACEKDFAKFSNTVAKTNERNLQNTNRKLKGR